MLKFISHCDKYIIMEQRGIPEETYSAEGITCPFCKFVDDQTVDIGLEKDGSEIEWECTNCGNSSRVTMSITRNYSAEPL